MRCLGRRFSNCRHSAVPQPPTDQTTQHHSQLRNNSQSLSQGEILPSFERGGGKRIGVGDLLTNWEASVAKLGWGNSETRHQFSCAQYFISLSSIHSHVIRHCQSLDSIALNVSQNFTSTSSLTNHEIWAAATARSISRELLASELFAYAWKKVQRVQWQVRKMIKFWKIN